VPAAPAKPEKVEELAQGFLQELSADLDMALDIYTSLTPFDLRDLLKAELDEAPHSPISLEIRRRLREFCRERAQSAADEIEKGD
jgi:hypothetical protein